MSLKPGEFYCFGKIVSPPQSSIHPRVRNGKTAYPKVNTSHRKQRATVERAIAAVSAHSERHPSDGMSKSRLSNLEKQLNEARH